MTDWLSIGNEDLTYRPRAKAGDKVYHANSNLVCTVEPKQKLLNGEETDFLVFATVGNISQLVGLEGRLLPEWEHVQ